MKLAVVWFAAVLANVGGGTAVAQASPQASTPAPAAPEPLRTTVTVVERVSPETPANVTVVDAPELDATPGTNLDDRLRAVPGFTLFKRASSEVANPTTQGVSLRGLGSSGASRTLVLWDSVPANDPFGGWIYWTQFVPDDIAAVEIARGGATSAFGDRAMSGTITMLSRPPEYLRLLFDYQTGNENTQDVSAGFSDLWRRWAISGAARAFTTDGYYIVPASIRGAVDRPAGVRFVTGNLRVDEFSPFGNFFFKVDVLAEERQNGTWLTKNSTGLGTASAHYVRDFGADAISVLFYDTQEGFHSTFSSVTNNRNTEKITYLQAVPSDAQGGSALWQHHKASWNLLAGVDIDRVHGVDTDLLRPKGERIGGGTLMDRGLFAQGDVEWNHLRLYAGVRESLTGRSGDFFSPTAGAAYGFHRLRFRGSVYRGFRAPTLNELYRSFSAGNTFTEANPNLIAETMWGAEAGADWSGENWGLRVTGYRNSLNNLITNVTLSSSASSIVRERENAAAALSRGVETEVHRNWRAFTGELSYLFVDARYVTGYRISQVPKNQGSASLTYRLAGTMFSVGMRAFDYQFDDDLNQYRLPGFAVLELAARRRLVGSLSAEASIENVCDRTYYTAFTPTPNIGQPRLWHIGLKWDGKL